MAAVAIQIRGTLYDLLSRTSRQVLLQGEASLLGLGIGGGPIEGGGGPVDPDYGVPIGGRPEHPIYWPPGTRPHPEHPIYDPPHIWGPNDPRPQPPIYIPPNVPPSLQPPDPPHPGDPVTPVPPPEGSPGWPVQPIQPPPYIVVNYPGVGPVTVPQPLTAQPK